MKYRIQYPKALYKFIVEYYDAGRGTNCNYKLAVDVGCGSGQATLPLAEYFSHVIGCDVSKDHVELAPCFEIRRIRSIRVRDIEIRLYCSVILFCSAKGVAPAR